MPMINIEDAYILSETGAQVDKVTGLFTKDEDTTEEEKTFAQLNIGASGGGGGGGRNLIDNAWFTINQRGATGASNGAYGLDRWFGVGTGYTVNSDGSVTVTGAMVQRNDWSFVWGKTVTISAMTADESVYSWTGTMATGTKSIGGLLNAVVVSSSQINFSAVSNLKALKLELGSVSTLANDAPPNYAEELAKCQRYFLKLTDVAYPCMCGANPAVVGVPVPTPVTMPDNVQIQSASVGWIRGGGNNYSSSASVNNMTPRPKANTIAIDVTHGVSGGLSAMTIYWINFSQLVFSADL